MSTWFAWLSIHFHWKKMLTPRFNGWDFPISCTYSQWVPGVMYQVYHDSCVHDLLHGSFPYPKVTLTIDSSTFYFLSNIYIYIYIERERESNSNLSEKKGSIMQGGAKIENYFRGVKVRKIFSGGLKLKFY